MVSLPLSRRGQTSAPIYWHSGTAIALGTVNLSNRGCHLESPYTCSDLVSSPGEVNSMLAI